MGTGNNGHLIHGNKGQILKRTKTVFGNREHKKTTLFILGEQSNLLQGNKGTCTPWDGLLFN